MGSVVETREAQAEREGTHVRGSCGDPEACCEEGAARACQGQKGDCAACFGASKCGLISSSGHTADGKCSTQRSRSVRHFVMRCMMQRLSDQPKVSADIRPKLGA